MLGGEAEIVLANGVIPLGRPILRLHQRRRDKNHRD